ncbi:MAG: YfhO family protein, partial [Chloroflexota bacterium]|nr:YfhO family protein [Chloroflexota bacterium]
SGLDSPLLDLLNARYLLVPATIPPGRPDLERLVGQHPTVYADNEVRVLENREVLPRAWIVHEGRQVTTPAEALGLLASGAVDPRTVALLEEALPALVPEADPTGDRASVLTYEPDRLRVQTSTTSPGLLVLSEAAYPAWQASVDGEPAPILTANALLRAIPVPAGEHTVELRYESATLQMGTVISLLAFLGLLGLWIAAGWRRHPRSGAPRES